MGSLAQYKKGPFGSSITKAMFVPDSSTAIKVYEQKNAINKDATLGNYFISAEKFESLKGFEVFPGDIIVSCAGTIGETYVMPEAMRKGIINQALMKISLYEVGILDFYLIYFDCQLKKSAQEQGHGVALKNIPPFDVLKKYLVPIPPIQEQTRITQFVTDLLDIVNTIDMKRNELYNYISSIKSKILDLAIRGKLVPQDPNDEPASVLLERIRAEKEELTKQGKIKRDKKESVIFKGDDNSYYRKTGSNIELIDTIIDLPKTWEWTNIGTLFSHNTGKALNSRKKEGQLLTYITTSNVYWGKFVLDNLKVMSFNENEVEKCTVKTGDLLVCEGGDIGRAAIWNFDTEIRIQNHLHRLRAYDKVNVKLYYYIFYLYKYTDKISGKGIGLQGLSSDALHNIEVPLPPLDEQKRIVDAIETLFAQIDKITEQIS